jgi:hypothetical protein
MARNPVAKKIDTDHADYDEILADWIASGRSKQFSRDGAFGGAIYQVMGDLTVDEPTFYQTASLGPTLYDDDSPAARPYQEGWYHVNRNYMRLKATRRSDGRIRIRRPVIPNEL